MADLGAIGIGGVNFSLWSDDVKFAEYPDDRYASFRNQDVGDESDIDVNVCIRVGSTPGLDGFKKIFDSQESWSMFARGKERHIVLGPPACPDMLWHGCMVLGSSEATVYCGERLLVDRDAGLTVIDPLTYPLDIMLVMYVLASMSGVIVHSCGMNVGGKGFLFPGRSRMGKSTLATLALPSSGVSVLSDDRIVVREINTEFQAFGTPWLGEAGIGENSNVPLAGIMFLKQSEVNSVSKISRIDSLRYLLPVVSVPWYDECVMTDVLSTCDNLIGAVPCYEFQFRKDADVVSMLAELDVIQKGGEEIFAH